MKCPLSVNGLEIGDNLTHELQRRITLSWAAFRKTPIVTKKTINKIRVIQVAMERFLLGFFLQDRGPDTLIRRGKGVVNALEKHASLKWNLAGHLSRTQDNIWPKLG